MVERGLLSRPVGEDSGGGEMNLSSGISEWRERGQEQGQRRTDDEKIEGAEESQLTSLS